MDSLKDMNSLGLLALAIVKSPFRATIPFDDMTYVQFSRGENEDCYRRGFKACQWEKAVHRNISFFFSFELIYSPRESSVQMPSINNASIPVPIGHRDGWSGFAMDTGTFMDWTLGFQCAGKRAEKCGCVILRRLVIESPHLLSESRRVTSHS